MKNNNGTKKPSKANLPASSNHGETRPADYLRTAKAHLRSGNQKSAFSLLQQAAVRFPEDPLILSYFGLLQALVDKKYRSGVENCRKAITLLMREASFGEEVLYPVFYLNLGRAYLAAGKKKDAVEAFQKGLKYDNGNSDLLKELRGLGVRKRPPVSFLDRSNPFNKYIGLILRAGKKEPEGRKGTRRRG